MFVWIPNSLNENPVPSSDSPVRESGEVGRSDRESKSVSSSMGEEYSDDGAAEYRDL